MTAVRSTLLRGWCVLTLGILAFPASAGAQEQAQRVIRERAGQEVSQQQILERLRTSGLTREQVQQRLQQAGYDATLADAYFDRLEAQQAVEAPGGGEGLPSPTSDFLSALQQIGVAVPGVSLAPEQEVAPEEPAEEEQEVAEEATPSTVSSRGLPIFGRNLFARATSEFQPVTTGPVDPEYRLGPGDQIILFLTGDVELAYTLDVNREGFIIIPDVGQVSVNGLSLGQLENRLYDRLGRVYSGVERGPEATTHVSVSLGRLRTKQVYLIGDVENPGAYQVSSVSRVFNALYNAGGPTTRGSFRIIQVRRGGNVIGEIDIYDYLLRGEAGNDIRLEQGDIVFVPMAGPRVSILGQVRRQAIFELREAEGLRAALEYAGGFTADAFVQRIQIDRILPPEQRMPGRERVLIDIDPQILSDDEAASVSLKDGDVIRVFGISDERRNRVTIRGDVFRPGVYEYIPGMTVHGLVQRADGLLPDVYTSVSHVLRVDPEDGTYTLHRLSLESDSTGAPVEDLDLQDLDEVVVYGQASLVRREAVEIAGPVRRSGTFPFAEGMTLRDLVLAAGGTEIETFPDRAHVARLREDLSRELLRYELDPDDMGIPLTEIPLEPGDRVSLFNRSDLLLPQDVSIYGLVKEPGTYSLAEGMTVEDLILTAGGFRKGARSLEVEVARLHISPERTDTIASVIRVALRGDPVLDGDGNGTQDGTQDGTSARVRDVSRETGPDWTLADWSPAADEFALEDGDRVFVRRLPGYVTPATVEVVGQVLYPGSYGLERRDETLSSVIRRAGGLTEEAYVAGFQLVRDGLPVAGDLEEAMKEPGGTKDLALRNGDRLVVPEYDPTVLVTGAVAFESRVIWRGGRGVDDYVSRAGGFTQDADEGRLSVSYLNGERDTPGRFLFWRSYPKVEPGSTIYVPVKPEDEGFDWDTFLTRALSVVGTVATVIAVTR